jgi:HD superfamily phosphodiesterase
MHNKIKKKVKRMLEGWDPAHDFHHIMRVYKNARLIGRREGSNMEIYEPFLSLYYHSHSVI